MVPPSKVALMKTITGDPSDNIKGIPRFPKKIAAKICEKFESVEDVKTKTLNYFPLTANQTEKFKIFVEQGEKNLSKIKVLCSFL